MVKGTISAKSQSDRPALSEDYIEKFGLLTATASTRRGNVIFISHETMDLPNHHPCRRTPPLKPDA